MKKLSSQSQEQAPAELQPAPSLPVSSATQPPPSKGILRAFASLRQRNFRLYWFGEMISLIGSWMQSIGQAWLVLDLTHSAWQLSLVGALQAVPILLFSLFGGVFADRWPKRRILVGTQSAALIQALFLWALSTTGTIQLWHIYILALLLGLTNSLDRPTHQAFVVELVGREDLPNAVALNSSISTLARIVGPSLGGLIIAASSVTSLFLLNAFSFLAVLASLAFMNGSALHAQPPQQNAQNTQPSTWQRLQQGVAYVWKTPAVLLVIVVVGLALLFGSNFNVFLPLFATNVLHIGPTGFGFLSSAFGIGSLLSALWMAWGNQQPAIRRVLLGALAFGTLEVGFALSPSYPLSFALIAAIGFLEIGFAMQAMTILQTTAPDHLRGRVMSVTLLFFDGSVPVGYLLAGWLAGLYGPSYALLTLALLSMLVAGIGWVWHKHIKRRGEDSATG
jgi:MFS family permease